MLKINNSFGIMSLHYEKEKKKPKEPEPEPESRQWTFEEMIHYQAMMPESTKDKFKTTAPQRALPQPKREVDIWEEKE